MNDINDKMAYEMSGNKLIDKNLYKKKWFTELRIQQQNLFIFFRLECSDSGLYEFNDLICKSQIRIKNIDKVLHSLNHLIFHVRDNLYFIPSHLDDGNPKNSFRNLAIQQLRLYDLWDDTNNTYKLPIAVEGNLQLAQERQPITNTASSPTAIPPEFLEALQIYPGTTSKTQNFKTFLKANDWREALTLLKPAILIEIKVKNDQKAIPNGFCPPWKNFNTWLNKRCWEDEYKGYNAESDSNDPLASFDDFEKAEHDRILNISGEEAAARYIRRQQAIKDGSCTDGTYIEESKLALIK